MSRAADPFAPLAAQAALAPDRTWLALVRGPDGALDRVLEGVDRAMGAPVTCLPSVRGLPGVPHGRAVLAGIDEAAARWLNRWREAVRSGGYRLVMWMPASRRFSLRAVAPDLDSWVGTWIDLPEAPPRPLLERLRRLPGRRCAWLGADADRAVAEAWGGALHWLEPPRVPSEPLPEGLVGYRGLVTPRMVRRALRHLAWHQRREGVVLDHPPVPLSAFPPVDDTVLSWEEAAARLAAAGCPEPARLAARLACLRQEVDERVASPTGKGAGVPPGDLAPWHDLPEADLWERHWPPRAPGPRWRQALAAWVAEGEPGVAGAVFEKLISSSADEEFVEAVRALNRAVGLPVEPFQDVTDLSLGSMVGDPEAEADLQAAWDALERGRPGEAIERIDPLLGRLEGRLGGDHPQVLLARRLWALALAELGDEAAALRCLETVVAALDRVLGRDHPEALRARVDLGDLLARRGDLSKARQVLEAALADLERVQGPTHPDTLDAMAALAAVLVHQDPVRFREVFSAFRDRFHRFSEAFRGALPAMQAYLAADPETRTRRGESPGYPGHTMRRLRRRVERLDLLHQAESGAPDRGA